MSKSKSGVRAAFREAVFQRDKHRCRVCGTPATKLALRSPPAVLDAHHITDRHDMPNGGYVVENGISLCPECHQKAEVWHHSPPGDPAYMPSALYLLVGSTPEKARAASEALKGGDQ
jgi:5-methylcytosine-specific restriction endonuclease McrA